MATWVTSGPPSLSRLRERGGVRADRGRTPNRTTRTPRHRGGARRRRRAVGDLGDLVPWGVSSAWHRGAAASGPHPDPLPRAGEGIVSASGAGPWRSHPPREARVEHVAQP